MSKEKIYIDGNDRTNEIVEYEVTETDYLIRFKVGDKFYPYSKENNRVIIKKQSIEPFIEFARIADSIKVTDDFSALGKYYADITIKENSLLHKYLNGIPFEKFGDVNPLVFPFQFNKSQLNATRKVFKNELSIIQGPPGTGKTQTILNIIANILIRGKNVAVVSNNNAAVDNIKDKLIEYGYESIFASLGSKNNQEDFFEHLVQQTSKSFEEELDEQNLGIHKKDLVELSHLIEQLLHKNREKKIITEKLNALKLETNYFNNAYVNSNIVNKNISFIKLGFDKLLDFLVDHHIMISENEKLTLKNKLELLVKYGVYRFKYLHEKDYEVIKQYQQIYYDLKIKKLEDKLTECENILQFHKFEDLTKEHCEISKRIFDHYLSQKFKEKKKYSLDSYKSDFDCFIKDYPVILSTAYSITYSIPKGFTFDYVIVDEASTLDLVKAVLPLSCAKNMVIVGDQKQLPHIVSEVEMSFENEAYDYNTKNIMDSLDCLYGDTIERTLLQEHYRCHPDIIRFCNMKYYDGELIVYSECSNNHAINVIETVPGNHMREITRGRRGNFNQRELEELNYLINNQNEYKVQLYSKNLNDFGLLSPYRLQIESSKEINPEEIEKDTIHKYQGREKPVIVFSTVLDQSAKSNMKMPFVNNPQLVNVAVSRAEKQLIIITNKEAFYKNGNDIGDLIKYIEYHDEKNIEEGQVISVFDLLYRDFSERLLERKSAMNNVKKEIQFESEKIIYSVISEILEKEIFQCYSFLHEVKLSDIFLNQDKCTQAEKKFIKQPRSSVDFILFNRYNKKPVLAIEVDGTAFHLNNPEQLERDKKKDGIFKKYDIPLMRLPTHKAITEGMIEEKIREVINDMIENRVEPELLKLTEN